MAAISAGETALFFFGGSGAGRARASSTPVRIGRAPASSCSMVSTSRLPSALRSTHCLLASMYLSPPAGSDTSMRSGRIGFLPCSASSTSRSTCALLLALLENKSSTAREFSIAWTISS